MYQGVVFCTRGTKVVTINQCTGGRGGGGSCCQQQVLVCWFQQGMVPPGSSSSTTTTTTTTTGGSSSTTIPGGVVPLPAVLVLVHRVLVLSKYTKEKKTQDEKNVVETGKVTSKTLQFIIVGTESLKDYLLLVPPNNHVINSQL